MISKAVSNETQGEAIWSKTFSATNAYLEVAKLVFKTLIELKNKDNDQQLQKMRELVASIRADIRRAEKRIIDAILESRLEERAGEVKGYQETLQEFAYLDDEVGKNVISVLLVDSAGTKQKVQATLAADPAPLDLRHSYFNVLIALLPLRILMHRYAGDTFDDKIQLIVDELSELIAYKRDALSVARRVGDNRTSTVLQEIFLSDELGPKWGTHFYLIQDGSRISLSFFFNLGDDLGFAKIEADQKRKRLAEAATQTVYEPVATAFEAAEELLKELGG